MMAWLADAQPFAARGLTGQCTRCGFEYCFLLPDIKVGLNGECPLCTLLRVEAEATQLEEQVTHRSCTLNLNQVQEYDKQLTAKFGCATLWCNTHIRCTLHALIKEYVDAHPERYIHTISLEELKQDVEFLPQLSARFEAAYPALFPVRLDVTCLDPIQLTYSVQHIVIGHINIYLQRTAVTFEEKIREAMRIHDGCEFIGFICRESHTLNFISSEGHTQCAIPEDMNVQEANACWAHLVETLDMRRVTNVSIDVPSMMFDALDISANAICVKSADTDGHGKPL